MAGGRHMTVMAGIGLSSGKERDWDDEIEWNGERLHGNDDDGSMICYFIEWNCFFLFFLI